MGVEIATHFGQRADDPNTWREVTGGEGADVSVPPWDGPEGPVGALGNVLTRSQLSSLPAIRPLVEGLVSRPAAVVLIGAYGLGKTVLAHSLAGSVATGSAWLGKPVEQHRTLVVVGEGAYGLDARIHAWEKAWHHGKPIPDDALTFLVKPGSLRERNTWQQLTEHAVSGGYGFVILDTFSSLAPDADEVKDAPLVMRRLSDLATHINGTALLVHHPGWSDNGRARGGYQFEANADEVLVLSGVAGEELVSLTRKKVKDGCSGTTVWLRRKATNGSVIIEQARAGDVEVPLRQRVLTVLEGCADVGATGPQLMAECEVDDKARSGFYAALAKLRDEGQVRTVGRRQRARYYLAEHAPEGAE